MTMTRTSGSASSSSSAFTRSRPRSAAIELLPFRASVMVPMRPSLEGVATVSVACSVISAISFQSQSKREEVDATGHMNHLAGYIPRLLGAEEGDGVGDVLGLARLAEHGALDDALVHLRVAHLEGLRADDPGRDDVGGDAVAAALEGNGLAQPHHRRLGRGIAGLAEAAQCPRDRSHEDDAAPFVLLHVRENSLGDVVRARQVDLDVAVPELVDLPFQGGDVVQGGGVVDEDVDLAEFLDHVLDDLMDLLAVGDVHLDGSRLTTHLADLAAG